MMTEEAKEARRAYLREYRQTHREHIREQQRTWAQNNKERVKASNERYWERKAEQQRADHAETK